MSENDVEAYEDELFQIKQHFLTKPWLRPTAKSRLASLEKWAQMFNEKSSNFQLDARFSGNLKTDWEQLTQFRSVCKLGIANAENAAQLQQVVHCALDIEEHYAKLFSGLFSDVESVKAGSPSDEMALNRAVERLFALNYVNVNELVGKETVLEMQFQDDLQALNELKRLSLLYTYLKAS